MNSTYNFSSLISPTSIEYFFAKYWEKEYLYISRNNEKYYDEILNIDDLDLFLQNKNLQVDSENFILAKEGERLSYDLWTKKQSNSQQYLLDNEKIFGLLNQGITLVINLVHKSIPKLTSFCTNLESELKFRLRTNIYITPTKSQGLVAHFDEHDVFILQITGSKIWRLYHSPIELPSQQKDQMIGQHSLDEPTFEEELKPGDLLYIPRGLIHQAYTTDTTSIHIALGLYPTYYFELLHDILKLAQDNPAFRKAIPHGFTNDEQKSQFKEEFQKLSRSLIDNLDIDELLEKKYDQFIAEKQSEYRNRFKDFIQLNKLNLNSVLSRRKNILFKTEKDRQNIQIKFSGKTLSFPIFFAASLSTILWNECFAVKDIGGMVNDEGKMKLATKFIQEGFLEIENINNESQK